MASLVKIRKKDRAAQEKEKGHHVNRSSVKGTPQNTIEHIPDGVKGSHGSLISVKEARDQDKKDTISLGAGRNGSVSSQDQLLRPSSSSSRISNDGFSTLGMYGESGHRRSLSQTNGESGRPASRPGSAQSTGRPPSERDTGSAPKQKTRKNNTIEPVSVQDMGSSASLKSKEAWSRSQENIALTPGISSRPSSSLRKSSAPSAISVTEAGDKVSERHSLEFAPPDMNLAHAYVPYLSARRCIEKMLQDMKNMKRSHITIVQSIESSYKTVETETQEHFDTFILTLRGSYGQKVKTFRQVIEVHRMELQQKQQYWDDALTSLSSKNHQLMDEKKKLLILNKVEFDRLENEKEQSLKDLMHALDDTKREMRDLQREHDKLLREIGDRHQSEIIVIKDNLKEDYDAKIKNLQERIQTMEKEHETLEQEKEAEKKVLQDELENEKNENERLRDIIEELKNRPETSAAVTAATVTLTQSRPITRSTERATPSVVVTDLSEEERRRMEEERKRMAEERQEMQEEREKIDKEMEKMAAERAVFQEDRIMFVGDLNSAKKDVESWKFKFYALEERLGELESLLRDYEVLKAQFEAAMAVASINTAEEHTRAEETIVKYEQDRNLCEEEKVQLTKELDDWEAKFVEANERKSEDGDRTDSARELQRSIAAVSLRLLCLTAQIDTIETLKKGHIPDPPKPDPLYIKVKEPEVKIVEVRVPDPEVLAQLDMTQRELEATKRQLMALIRDKARFREEITTLSEENAQRLQRERHLEVEIQELERLLQEEKLRQAVQGQDTVEAGGGVDPELLAELERKLKAKERELRDAELRHRDEMDGQKKEHEKLIGEMEMDIKKLLKEIAKLRKKLQGQGGETKDDSEMEAQIEKLEVQVLELEHQNKDLNADKDHMGRLNDDLRRRLAELDTDLDDTEKKAAHLSAAVANATALQSQLAALQRQVDELKDKVKVLHDGELELKTKLSEEARRYELEKSDLEQQNKKLEQEIRRLEQKLEGRPANEVLQLSKAENKADDMEISVFDLQHKMSALEADRDHLNNNNKTLMDRIKELEQEALSADRKLADLGAAAAANESTQQHLAQATLELDDLQHSLKELEEQLRKKEKELRDKEREHERELWEKEKVEKDTKNDLKKMARENEKLKERLAAALKDAVGQDSNAGQDVQPLQDKIAELEEKLNGAELDSDHNKKLSQKLDDKCKELQGSLGEAQEKIVTLRAAAAAEVDLEGARLEIDALRRQIMALEETLRERRRELDERDIVLKQKERDMRHMERQHSEQMREKEKMEKEMHNDIKKLLKQIAKLKKRLQATGDDHHQGAAGGDAEALEKEVDQLEDKVTELEKKVVDVDTELRAAVADKTGLERDNERLSDRLKDLKKELEAAEEQSAAASIEIAAMATTPGPDVQDLTYQIGDLQNQVDNLERILRQERSDHEITREELEALRRQIAALRSEMKNLKADDQARLEGATTKLNAEINNLQKKVSIAEAELEASDTARLANLPVDAAKEIAALKGKLIAARNERDESTKVNVSLEAEAKQLQIKVASLEKATKTHKKAISEAERNLKEKSSEKDKLMKQVTADNDKKEKQRAEQEKKKLTALQLKIQQLENAPRGKAVARVASAAGGRGDAKALQASQDKLREVKNENADLRRQLKALETDLRRGGATGPTGNDPETQRALKKNEKVAKELEKQLEQEKRKAQKYDDSAKKLERELKETQKDVKEKQNEIDKLTSDLAALGTSASMLAEATDKIRILEKDSKKLKDENKTLSDNFNSERVLRKKYYNMVEDMKGKIRVYCRVRPMSRSEEDRGNYSIIKSPDEYTVSVTTPRGLKDFQFDSIFMPQATQEQVFEDTNNLIQSAVDGYNVCIFAYGQTGSGKTFTIIGDRQGDQPGIAPRAFDKIYQLLNENKSKFSYKVSCYMLELYNDKLLDLFAKPTPLAEFSGHTEKLEIKKDKKGMVVVPGSEVKPARNAKELFALFEEGSKTRHTASTKMNAESSRSHLVIGIVIETINKSTGQVLRGKLSLVDLAGSERAAKTGAGAEQLKEAMSINKSLSALGDVISALSSEQQFIPYRNNKLTMLMQDSLGGNAKTLMFVNVSPADYNTEESVVSLTYASRVKLITNDAQKNSDNKEIARLKAVISKLKKGDAVAEDDDLEDA